MFVIMPDYISDQITAKVDEIIAQFPQLEGERENIRSDLVKCFSENGHMDVTITPTNK